MQELAAHQTHLREMEPFPLTWEGATDASGSGMCGVSQDLEVQRFVWQSTLSKETQVQLVTYTNPTGVVTINDLELATLLAQVQLFTPRWTP